jgi:hypothetical protein
MFLTQNQTAVAVFTEGGCKQARYPDFLVCRANNVKFVG